jgi:hypothetical protein
LAVGEHPSALRLGDRGSDYGDGGGMGADGGVEEDRVGGTEPVDTTGDGLGVGAGRWEASDWTLRVMSEETIYWQALGCLAA